MTAPSLHLSSLALAGFDVAVAENACKLAGLECELVLVDALADRIPMLLNGTVDILFAG